MGRDSRVRLLRILVSAVLLTAAYVTVRIITPPMWAELLLYLPAYLVVGYDVLWEAVEGIREGSFLNENFLMAVATVGALVIGFLPAAQPECAEAVFVMLFFQIGELFEEIAEGRSRRSVIGLMDLRPDRASVERNGSIITVDPDTVTVGEIVVIRPGEKVPMDGVILDGSSALNTVALTGESLPRDVTPGDTVLSGCVNLTGLLRVRVTKVFGESAASKILALVENAAENKSRSETFIRKFARVYTPAVVGAAVLLAFIPPLLSGDFSASFPVWLHRALTFLVVSCPCALVISVPLTFFSGIGGASKRGILIKGSGFMEALARVGTVVFDKTGTLTHGVFRVTAVHPEVCDESHLLHLAAHVERFSTHPIAVSLRQAYPDEADDCSVTDVEEIPGQGIRAQVNGYSVCVGNAAMMDACGVQWTECSHVGTILHVTIDGVYAGHIVISDEVKEDAASAVSALHHLGVTRTVMLTGDREEVGRHVAHMLGLSEYRAELLPADKVTEVERLLTTRAKDRTLAFVGDGINDAPVLARADIGIAMGAMGTDAAIEAADVVLMDDRLMKLADAVRISRRTIAIARQNIVFALTVKAVILILAALGYTPMSLAVFGDVGVTVLAILNAMRAMKS